MKVIAEINTSTVAGRKIARELAKHPASVRLSDPNLKLDSTGIPEGGCNWETAQNELWKGLEGIYGQDLRKL